MSNTHSVPRHTIKCVDSKAYFLKAVPVDLFLICKPSTLVAVILEEKGKPCFLHQYRWEIWEVRVTYDWWK